MLTSRSSHVISVPVTSLVEPVIDTASSRLVPVGRDTAHYKVCAQHRLRNKALQGILRPMSSNSQIANGAGLSLNLELLEPLAGRLGVILRRNQDT